MSACAQCGTVAKPNDRFCNGCGTPVVRPAAPNAPAYAPPGPQYAPTPLPGPAHGGYGPPQQNALAATAMATHRCQMGHEITPGASYCAQGHPIALDQMQFANEPSYGGPSAGGQGYGAPQPSPGFGPPAAPNYGTPAPPPGYGQAQPQAYAPAPPQPVYAPPPPQPVYAAPQPAYSPQPVYAPQPPVYAPSAPPAYGVPASNAYAQPQQAPLPSYAAEQAAPEKVLRGFLVAYGTNASGDFWPLTGGRHVVGRLGPGDGIDISLQDPTISSRHGAFTVDAASGSITMEDTGSTNGTFVNDEHIGFNGRRELRDGDRLRLGGFTTIVKVIGRI
jgi:hypothetical protein